MSESEVQWSIRHEGGEVAEPSPDRECVLDDKTWYEGQIPSKKVTLVKRVVTWTEWIEAGDDE